MNTYINLFKIAMGMYSNNCNCPQCKKIAEKIKTQAAKEGRVIPKLNVPTSLTDVIDSLEEDVIDSQEEKDEVAIIKREFGELTEGRIIEIELAKACEILGKTRKRVDAFKGIISKLRKDYGVTLIIKSKKSR